MAYSLCLSVCLAQFECVLLFLFALWSLSSTLRRRRQRRPHQKRPAIGERAVFRNTLGGTTFTRAHMGKPFGAADVSFAMFNAVSYTWGYVAAFFVSLSSSHLIVISK